ncbi:MAG: DNA-processing protein DprA [Gammaproteobacteria bacterium]
MSVAARKEGAAVERDERAAWLALHRAPGVGARTFHRLLRRFGSARAALSAEARALEEARVRAPALAYLRAPDWAAVDTTLAWAAVPDQHLVLLSDPGYPPQLRDLDDAPPVLHVLGDPRYLGQPQVAMVGSRNATQTGKQLARAWAAELAAAGIGITSGMAYGVDAAAHQGALDGNGFTVAVLGTGADRTYPTGHAPLAEAIRRSGALLSELPLGTAPIAENFPRRNRIISGLALATVVIEAQLGSGSLITARHAMAQGREVFAVPGPVASPGSRGCHALIREGAVLVESVGEVLRDLAPQLHAAVDPGLRAQADAVAAQPQLEADYQHLLNCIEHEPVPIDTLVERSGLTAQAVSSMLLILELQGYVRSEAGGKYARAARK